MVLSEIIGGLIVFCIAVLMLHVVLENVDTLGRFRSAVLVLLINLTCILFLQTYQGSIYWSGVFLLGLANFFVGKSGGRR